jgi:hypothetical protein
MTAIVEDDLEAAAKYCEEAIEIAKGSGERHRTAFRMSILSYIHVNQGRYVSSLVESQYALDLFKELGWFLAYFCSPPF